jgi:hypothetical protein
MARVVVIYPKGDAAFEKTRNEEKWRQNLSGKAGR